MNTKRIGWVGLGKMGVPMAKRLLDAGFDLTVYNRNKEKEPQLASLGAATAPTPLAVAAQSDLVILMVTDDQATKELFTGEDGLLGNNNSQKLFINMSTVSPGISREMAALCTGQGCAYIDAPVSGSVKQAEDGQLVIMAGGAADQVSVAKPVLEHMGKMLIHLGETGSGNTAKLAINTLLAFYAQGLAEMLVFAGKNGLHTADLMNMVNNGALGNTFTRLKSEVIMNDNYAPVFALKHIVKDLQLAANEGFDSPMSQVALDTFSAAAPSVGELDIIAIFKYLNQLS